MVETHPSHETDTKKPYLRVGQRVRYAGLEGQIEEIRNSGSEQIPIFEYMVTYDNPKANDNRGWLASTDLTEI